MGLGPIIVKLLQKIIKTTFKVEKGIDNLMEKLKIEGGCPQPDKLKEFIDKKNRISNGLNNALNILKTINTTNTSIETLMTALNTAITVVKALPIPLSVPPGVGLPLNVPVLASDGLEILKDLVKMNKGIVSQSTKGIGIVTDFINKVLNKLKELDNILNECVQNYQNEGILKPEEVNSLYAEIKSTATNFNNLGFGGEKNNKSEGEELLSQLIPNSINPMVYKGFRLEIQPDPKNPSGNIPRNRMVAFQETTNILSVATDYSFTSNTEVQVNELKYLIDQYLKINPATTQ